MRIHVRGDNIEITDALREYVGKKVGRLEKYFDAPPAHDVHVTLSVERDFHKVEVTMPLNGIILRAEEKSGDMYASIDLVSDKLETQIERYKSKINKRFKQEGLRSLFKDGSGEAVPWREEENAAKVVRVKKFAMKPMPLEEAIMQMDLLGHDFFVFSNAETEEVNVIYRRRDGQYGLIEPAFA
jgi:putative sigma-54 modulation protein